MPRNQQFYEKGPLSTEATIQSHVTTRLCVAISGTKASYRQLQRVGDDPIEFAPFLVSIRIDEFRRTIEFVRSESFHRIRHLFG
jgi:hypothetical protein